MNTSTTHPKPERLTAFVIGIELLPPGKIDAAALLAAMEANPANVLDILIAGGIDILETLPPKQAVQQIRSMLLGAADLAD